MEAADGATFCEKQKDNDCHVTRVCKVARKSFFNKTKIEIKISKKKDFNSSKKTTERGN